MSQAASYLPSKTGHLLLAGVLHSLWLLVPGLSSCFCHRFLYSCEISTDRSMATILGSCYKIIIFSKLRESQYKEVSKMDPIKCI